jgi:hypothetical protein
VKRCAAPLLLAVLLAVSAPAAEGYWHAGGTGTGQAPVASLPGAGQPAVIASGASVTVQWTQTTFLGRPLGGYAGGGYVVRRIPAAGGTAVTPGGSCATTQTGTTATLTCQETSVPPGTWRYTITPVLRTWTGAAATSAAVTILPAAPTLAAVTAQNPATGAATGAIAITWSAVVGAAGYNLYRRTGSGAYDFSAPLNGALPLTTTGYTDPGAGLTGSTTYSYVVRAVTAGLESASSNERSATAIARPPAPASVTATPRAAARIDIGWASVAGAAGYNVYRRTATGTYDLAAPLNGATPLTVTTFADTTAANGTTYFYVVRSLITGAGGVGVESASSAEATTTADGAAPTAVSLTNPGSPLRGSVNLTGTATDTGSGLASLRFQYTAAGGSTWTDICTDTSSPYGCTLATTGLTDGLYDLRVIATDVAGNSTTSSSVTIRRVDNTAPAATMTDPGQYLRAAVTLGATGADAGSGLATLRIQRAPTGTSTWTDVCSTTTSPASCALTTTTLTDGGYDLRAVATDQAGNVTNSAIVSNRIVDNTAPRGTDIQITNGPGGVVGLPQQGDVVTYTFSEPIRPASILAGWTGTATAVTVRLSSATSSLLTVYNSANTAQLPLGSISTGRRYTAVATTFTASTMVQSGNTISITLGSNGLALTLFTSNTTLQWTTAITATDLAGNAVVAATVAETGTADPDF